MVQDKYSAKKSFGCSDSGIIGIALRTNPYWPMQGNQISSSRND